MIGDEWIDQITWVIDDVPS